MDAHESLSSRHGEEWFILYVIRYHWTHQEMSVTSEESVAHHAAEEFSTTELLRMIIEGKYADPIRCLQTLRGYFRDILVRLDLEHMILARVRDKDATRRPPTTENPTTHPYIAFTKCLFLSKTRFPPT